MNESELTSKQKRNTCGDLWASAFHLVLSKVKGDTLLINDPQLTTPYPRFSSDVEVRFTISKPTRFKAASEEFID